MFGEDEGDQQGVYQNQQDLQTCGYPMKAKYKRAEQYKSSKEK